MFSPLFLLVTVTPLLLASPPRPVTPHPYPAYDVNTQNTRPQPASIPPAPSSYNILRQARGAHSREGQASSHISPHQRPHSAWHLPAQTNTWPTQQYASYAAQQPYLQPGYPSRQESATTNPNLWSTQRPSYSHGIQPQPPNPSRYVRVPPRDRDHDRFPTQRAQLPGQDPGGACRTNDDTEATWEAFERCSSSDLSVGFDHQSGCLEIWVHTGFTISYETKGYCYRRREPQETTRRTHYPNEINLRGPCYKNEDDEVLRKVTAEECFAHQCFRGFDHVNGCFEHGYHYQRYFNDDDDEKRGDCIVPKWSLR